MKDCGGLFCLGNDMPDIECALISEAVQHVLAGRRTAVLFQEDDLRVKATRKCVFNKRSRIKEVLVTVGKPNYRERQYVKRCKKLGVNAIIWFPHEKRD